MSKRLFPLLFCFISFSCTPKGTGLPKNDEQKVEKTDQITQPLPELKKSIFSKTLRESIYFSNSLEREALKLILKDNSFQKNTLFSVLSYVVETNSGAKKTTPFGLDCGQFLVKPEGKYLRIIKACVKPYSEIATIRTVEDENLYEVEFLIKEWASVVGLAVTLTGDNLRCSLRVKEKKLSVLNCDNWSYQTSADQFSSTVVKAREYVFNREAKKQFVIRGGFFKELVENKKIDIMVPLEGKIRIIEKELRVIDEFANKLNEESRVQREKEEEYKKHIAAEATKKSPQEGSQDISQESGQEGAKESQEASQDSSQENPEATPQTPVEGDSRGNRGR